MSTLAGRTVVITGAANGLGRAYAIAAAGEGANVVCSDIDEAGLDGLAHEIRDAGGQVLTRRASVLSLDELAGLAAAAVDTFGRIDGLVNNAGVMGVIPMSRVPFEEVPDDEWDLVFDTNVKGTWYACKAVVPHLRARGGGSIINVSSSTHFAGDATRIHYVASKSALIGFTRTLSRELGQDAIRVNAIAPGSILTEVNPSPRMLEHRQRWVDRQALKHLLTSEDSVGVVLFLLSDASRYMTGQTIVVDGGAVYT
jgi:3-oxoacyl-[acyl-carrier protein] reductase